MTRPGRSSRPSALAALFAADAEAAIVEVIRSAPAPVTRRDVLAALRAAGVDELEAARVWKRLRPAIQAHEQVVTEGTRYHWVRAPRTLTATDALRALERGGLRADRRARLAAVVRAGSSSPMAAREPAAPAGHAAGAGGSAEVAARRRQDAIDGVRALAELAIEVEELVANEASARALLHRVRARVKRAGLEPIERAGERITFDQKHHVPVGRSIPEGKPVVVIRPGYRWESDTEELLIAKAVVQEGD